MRSTSRGPDGALETRMNPHFQRPPKVGTHAGRQPPVDAARDDESVSSIRPVSAGHCRTGCMAPQAGPGLRQAGIPLLNRNLHPATGSARYHRKRPGWRPHCTQRKLEAEVRRGLERKAVHRNGDCPPHGDSFSSQLRHIHPCNLARTPGVSRPHAIIQHRSAHPPRFRLRPRSTPPLPMRTCRGSSGRWICACCGSASSRCCWARWCRWSPRR